MARAEMLLKRSRTRLRSSRTDVQPANEGNIAPQNLGRKEAVKNTASQTDKDVLDESSSDDSLPSFAALQAARSSKKRYRSPSPQTNKDVLDDSSSDDSLPSFAQFQAAKKQYGNSKAWTHPNPIVRDDDSEPSKADFETLRSLRASLKAKRKSAAMRKKVSRSSKAKPTSMSRANIMLSPTPLKKATTFLDPDGSDSSLSSAPDSLRSESSTPQGTHGLSDDPLEEQNDASVTPAHLESTCANDEPATKFSSADKQTSRMDFTFPQGPVLEKEAGTTQKEVQEKMDSSGDEVDLQDGKGVRDAVHAMHSIEVTKSSPKADQERGGLAALTSKSHGPSDTIAVIPRMPPKQTNDQAFEPISRRTRKMQAFTGPPRKVMTAPDSESQNNRPKKSTIVPQNVQATGETSESLTDRRIEFLYSQVPEAKVQHALPRLQAAIRNGGFKNAMPAQERNSRPSPHQGLFTNYGRDQMFRNFGWQARNHQKRTGVHPFNRTSEDMEAILNKKSKSRQDEGNIPSSHDQAAASSAAAPGVPFSPSRARLELSRTVLVNAMFKLRDAQDALNDRKASTVKAERPVRESRSWGGAAIPQRQVQELYALAVQAERQAEAVMVQAVSALQQAKVDFEGLGGKMEDVVHKHQDHETSDGDNGLWDRLWAYVNAGSDSDGEGDGKVEGALKKKRKLAHQQI